jgi:hypothetical protein
MKTILANVISTTDGIGDVEELEVKLSDTASLNIKSAKYLFKEYKGLFDTISVKHTGTKLTALSEDEPVGIRLETFELHVEESGTIMVRAYLKENLSEYVDAEFML